MSHRIIGILLIALAMGPTLSATPIYKWVDKNGNVHYSTVPQNPNAQPLKILNTAGNRIPSAARLPTAASSNAADRALTRTTPSDSAACKSARKTLSNYLGASYLYTLDKHGKKRQLSKARQGQAIDQAKIAIVKACPPPE